ncbi:hypothetical protein J14TS5_21290 [Paenibacillus lautus]|nr:hypothetical protein J14TS5_21290 [Paenibacillus lautus]
MSSSLQKVREVYCDFLCIQVRLDLFLNRTVFCTLEAAAMLYCSYALEQNFCAKKNGISAAKVHIKIGEVNQVWNLDN